MALVTLCGFSRCFKRYFKTTLIFYLFGALVINKTRFHFRGWTGTSLQVRLMQGVFSTGQFRYIKTLTDLAPMLRGIKRKKSNRGWGMNNSFLLFYYPKPQGQVKILMYFNLHNFDIHLLFFRRSPHCKLVPINTVNTQMVHT